VLVLRHPLFPGSPPPPAHRCLPLSQGPCRESEDVVFVADSPIPITAASFYFEVALEASGLERGSKDAPSLSIGLWSSHALATSQHGNQWGMGSYVYNSREGFKGRCVGVRTGWGRGG
jgi:hypothetical protein